MDETVRFGVSMEKKLLNNFDRFIKKNQYANRSECIRDMIRKSLVDEEWEKGQEVAGSIIMVYDHHHRRLLEKTVSVQHKFHALIISTQHIHMDHENCLEIIVVRGNSEKIREIYNTLKTLKGVKYTAISKATTGKQL